MDRFAACRAGSLTPPLFATDADSDISVGRLAQPPPPKAIRRLSQPPYRSEGYSDAAGISFFIANPASARELSEDEVLDFQKAFESKQRGLQSFEAGLRQTLKLEGMKRPVVSEGRLFYQSEDMLRIQFRQPSEEMVLIRGKDVWSQKSGKKVIHRRANREAPHMLALLAVFQNGAAESSRYYEVSMAKNSRELVVTLTPREPRERGPSRIVNRLKLPSLEIRSIEVSLGEEGTLTYEFMEPKRNGKIDPELFHEPEE